jgi:ubiquinone/menaquinone biosynthesis C-methylase UbiE
MFEFLKKKEAAPQPQVAAAQPGQDELIDRVVAALGVSDDDTILQVGYGGPAAIQHLLPQLTQGRLAGIDRDAAKVRLANDHSPEAFRSFKLEFKEGVVSRIPFPNEHFSKVFALDTVGTWLNIPKGLSEISRVLLPLGRVVFSLPPAARRQGEHVPPAEIRGLLQDAGFENMEVLPAPDADASTIITAQKTFS